MVQLIFTRSATAGGRISWCLTKSWKPPPVTYRPRIGRASALVVAWGLRLVSPATEAIVSAIEQRSTSSEVRGRFIDGCSSFRLKPEATLTQGTGCTSLPPLARDPLGLRRPLGVPHVQDHLDRPEDQPVSVRQSHPIGN